MATLAPCFANSFAASQIRRELDQVAADLSKLRRLAQEHQASLVFLAGFASTHDRQPRELLECI